jgi:ParB-like chromosome segregation protein Spo0J
MTRRLGKTTATQKPAIRLDDNVESYDVARDGRSGEGRIQLFRIDRIEASPFQVRRVFPEREVEELAGSIRSHGLIHEPRGRPHPAKPGWVELMPGEMRVRALRRLVERGEAEGLLEKDFEGQWLIPIKIDAVDDDRAEAMVLSENLDRTDLSAWEWALAWQQRRESLRRRDQPSGIRDVAASIGKKFQTVAEYLRVAEALTIDVLMAAGVVHGGEPDHRRMAALSLAALQRVARASDTGTAAAAEQLLHELNRAGDSTAATVLAERRQARRKVRQSAGSGFQINIRQAIAELSPQQSAHYLAKMTPVLAILSEQAVQEIDGGTASRLADELEAAAARLRGVRG